MSVFSEEDLQHLPDDVKEMLKAAGVDADVINKGLEPIRRAMTMAQNSYLLHIERCADLDINPVVAVLSFYQMGHLQVEGNLKAQTLNRGDVRGFRKGAEMCAGVATERRLVLDENNNLVDLPIEQESAQ